MSRALATASVLMLLTAAALASPPRWVEVRSPHFDVFSDGGASAARHVAGQMERMRQVFHQVFPTLQLDTAQPLEIVALRDQKEFKALLPDSFRQGSYRLAGMFYRTTFRDFILLDLDDLGGPDPYRIIYHEYTHYILDRFPFELPVWLNEGLAEFYETTQIEGDSASLGRTDAYNLQLLQQKPLIPLPLLFAIGPNSPYYHEQDKASIFYAESWALVHYFMLRDFMHHTQILTSYLLRLSQGGDPVKAAAASFGNLTALQKTIELSTRQLSFRYVRVPLRVKVDEKRFVEIPMAPPDAVAVQADVLAHEQRFRDALALLQPLLQRAPDNARADDTRGFIAYRQNDWTAAETWLSRAAVANPNDALAQVLLGAAALRQSPQLSPSQATAAMAHLRAAVRLRPDFAPAFNLLAQAEAADPQTLAAAEKAEAEAIALAPAEFAYRWNAAGLALRSGDWPQGLRLLQAALQHADTPARVLQCQQEMRAVQQRMQPLSAPPAPLSAPAAPQPSGSEQVVQGEVIWESCQAQTPDGGVSLAIDLESHGQRQRYFAAPDLHYSAILMPGQKFNPCTDLQGRQVKVSLTGGRMDLIQVQGTIGKPRS